MGLGSFLFHGTSRYYFELLDEIPMLLVSNELLYLFYGKTRLTMSPNLYMYNSVNIMITTCTYIIFKNYSYFLFIFAMSILNIIVVGFSYKKSNKTDLYLSIGSMTTGKILWDIEQKYCNSYDWVYLLHSLWHLLSATSLYYIIKYAK